MTSAFDRVARYPIDIFKLTSQIRTEDFKWGIVALRPTRNQAFNIQLENFIPDPRKRGIG